MAFGRLIGTIMPISGQGVKQHILCCRFGPKHHPGKVLNWVRSDPDVSHFSFFEWGVNSVAGNSTIWQCAVTTPALEVLQLTRRLRDAAKNKRSGKIREFSFKRWKWLPSKCHFGFFMGVRVSSLGVWPPYRHYYADIRPRS